MWIARDKDGTLKLFSEKPHRIDNDDDMWLSFVWYPKNVHTCKRMHLNSSEFPNLKWEDEPMEVILLPKPTEETIKTNPIYHDIYCLGYNDCQHAEDEVSQKLNEFVQSQESLPADIAEIVNNHFFEML